MDDPSVKWYYNNLDMSDELPWQGLEGVLMQNKRFGMN